MKLILRMGISSYLQCGVKVRWIFYGTIDATVNIFITYFMFKYSKLQKENY
jgi:hypothetical protein